MLNQRLMIDELPYTMLLLMVIYLLLNIIEKKINVMLNLNIIKHFVEKENFDICEIKDTDDNTVLYYAEAKSKDKDGHNSIHIGSAKGHLDIVEYLTKECKCDVESKNNYGEIPLHCASRYGCLDYVTQCKK